MNPEPPFRVSPTTSGKARTSWPKVAARRARRKASGSVAAKHGRLGWRQQQARGLKGWS